MTKDEIIICSCGSTEHQMVFHPSPFENEKEVFIHIHLNKRPWLERLKYGMKYIFGYQCAYGAFDEMIISKDNVGKLKEVIKYLEE